MGGDRCREGNCVTPCAVRASVVNVGERQKEVGKSLLPRPGLRRSSALGSLVGSLANDACNVSCRVRSPKRHVNGNECRRALT